MRTGIVLASFLPFLYYASKDTLFHFRGRRVSLTEHVLHLAIGLTLIVVVTSAVLGNFGLMLIGLLLFGLAGGIDEYLWHRGIPAEESDLHAKEHLALLLFVVMSLVVNWLDDHQWRIPPELWNVAAGASRSLERPTLQVAASGSLPARPWWRAVFVPAFLLPYAYFGLQDNLHHVRRRRVAWTERILHAAIVLSLFTVVPQAIFGSRSIMLVGLLLFLVARVLDEICFHRNLSGEESALHAKTHFAFLAFVVLGMGVDYLTQRGWT